MPSPKKDDEKSIQDAAARPPEVMEVHAAEGPDEHVSGPPVKQTMFGKIRSMSMVAKDKLKNFKEAIIPRRDPGDVDEGDSEERPQTATTKTKTSTDDDGPVWEPGTEQLMWTDPTYVVQKYVQPGIHPNHNRHFVKPTMWWQSAESAIKMLEAERRGLKAASLDRQNLLARTLLATNRLVSTRLQGTQAGPTAMDKNQFRGGVEPIQHVLPPDVQRALHSKLCTATKNGEKEVILQLLLFDIDLDYSDQFGTPLHYAAFFGQLQAAHLLLEKGSFPGALNYREQTPLHIAATKNAYTVVDLLVRYGAPLNAIEMGGLTAMQIACTHGFLKVVENLIIGGADCDKPNRIGWSPLHLACMGMHHEVIEKLCISGMANSNAPIDRTRDVLVGKGRMQYEFHVVKGDTPGHFAARKAFFMCLKVLLENGCDPCAVNDDGETMMHLAVQTCDIRCVERILEYGWDFIDMEDKHGRDPIDVCDDVLARYTGDEPEPVRIRKVVNEIKTLLQKTSVRKNQHAHKELMEQAKRGVGGRKKNQNEAPPPVELAEEKKFELEEKPMDDRTMEEKMTAMKIELESARAEARAAEAQSRMKTYSLNESLLETKRRLVETEFMLERERDSRLALEQDVMGLIGVEEEEEEESWRGKGLFSGQSSRTGTAQEAYEAGSTYEFMRIPSYEERQMSAALEGPRAETAESSRTAPWLASHRAPPGVMKKDFGRSLSSSSQSVKFAETENLDDELDEYERSEAMAGAPPRQLQPMSASPGVLRQSSAHRGAYSGQSALEHMSSRVRNLLYASMSRLSPASGPCYSTSSS